MRVRTAEVSKGWWEWRSGVSDDGASGKRKRKSGRSVREGQRALRNEPSVPCSAAVGINEGYHPVLDMPAENR
jgi:hypothetical protein